jgi:hypothetical protein
MDDPAAECERARCQPSSPAAPTVTAAVADVFLPAGPATLRSLRFPAAVELCLLFGMESSSTDNRYNEVLAATRSHAPEFMGLSDVQARALAEKLGIELQVRSKDEPITADARARRLTVDLSTGVVTDARAG